MSDLTTEEVAALCARLEKRRVLRRTCDPLLTLSVPDEDCIAAAAALRAIGVERDALAQAERRAFQQLELYGVGQERARSVHHGISVLMVRVFRERAAALDSQIKPVRPGGDVLAEVAAECDRALKKCGGAEHDDRHSTADFVQFIEDYAAWARQMASMGSYDKARRRLIQVASLGVNAVRSIDRKRAAYFGRVRQP